MRPAYAPPPQRPHQQQQQQQQYAAQRPNYPPPSRASPSGPTAPVLQQPFYQNPPFSSPPPQASYNMVDTRIPPPGFAPRVRSQSPESIAYSDSEVSDASFFNRPQPPNFRIPAKAPGTQPPYLSEPSESTRPLRPATSYALMNPSSERTNLGHTKLVMSLLSEMWIVNLAFIIGGTWLKSFYLGDLQQYDDYNLWGISCYWKLGLLFPLPYTLICFFGLTLPFRTPKFLDYSGEKRRRLDNLYILTVTKGDNREAVYRAWNAHKHLEGLHS
ncbi:hypothetical protein HDU82_002773, partial [Entophlyctis luteolus]